MTDDIFQRLRAAYCSQDGIVPPGFRTRIQYQRDWGTCTSYTTALLSEGVRKGIIERVEVKIGGRVIPHYGLPRKLTRSTRPKT